MAYHHDRDYFRRPRFQSLNENETATVSGEPFLLEGDGSQSLGVVLAHGFLASPAEMRGLAEVIHARGHTVYGVRLKGHGTSPHDLRTRACEEWLASVRRGIRIVSGLAQRVAVVGFSTGGSLALHTAGEAGMELAGVCAICVPVRFQNPHMRYVPLVHRANRLVRSMSSLDAVKAFTPNASENPEINYQNMPVRGLYELRRLVDAMLERVADIRCPVCLVQATEDPVVVPDSIDTLRERITGARVESFLIDAEHHGIVYRNEGETWSRVLAFLEKL